MIKLLGNIEKYMIIVGVALFAVFVLPGFPSPYFIPKEILMVGVLSIALIASALKGIIKGELKFASGKFDIGIILLMIAYLLASIFKTPNKMEAFFYPGTTTFVILSVLTYLIINQFSKKGKNEVVLAVFASGILLSVITLFSRLGMFVKIPQLPAFMKDTTFTPLGAVLPTVIYLLTVLPIGIVQIFKENDIVKRIFFGVSSSVIILGAVLIGTTLLPGKSQSLTLPTWQTSWVVLVESLKSSPVLGTGPGNYLSIFNTSRPLSYNQTGLWQVRFSSANNYYFTLITELGLAGLAALIILFIQIFKVRKGASLLILIAAFAIFPASPALILLFMVLLSILSGSEEKSAVIAANRLPAIIVAVPVFLAVTALAFFGGKAIAAEITYKKSLDSLTKGDAKNTYGYMSRAIKLNPYVDRYHASMAQIDMALATSLANSKTISDTDRQTVTQLVQEAITEGKATVALNSGRSGNWEVLAQIYKSILSFAQGSDQFAIQAYTQAVALDPINPNLRIALGGVYYALGDYDNAISAFQVATLAKSDLANSHYNLASAYAAKKEYDKAITEMDTVLTLVAKDSDDYKTAVNALEQYKKQKFSAASSNNLTAPETVKKFAN